MAKDINDALEALETRLALLEKIVLSPEYRRHNEFMESLYQKVCEVFKDKKSTTVIRIQKKFLIDFERAKALYERLPDSN